MTPVVIGITLVIGFVPVATIVSAFVSTPTAFHGAIPATIAVSAATNPLTIVLTGAPVVVRRILQRLPRSFAVPLLLPVQPYVCITLHVERKGDQNVSHDGRDNTDQRRPVAGQVAGRSITRCAVVAKRAAAGKGRP